MKINNGVKSFDRLSAVGDILLERPSNRMKLGIIIRLVVDSAGALGLMIVLCYYCFVGQWRSKAGACAPAWLPLPLYGNSHTISKVSTTSQRSGTVSYISLASKNLGRVFTFQEIMYTTNKCDKRLVLGISGFGKVYMGMLEDDTVVTVKRGNLMSEQGLAKFHTKIG